jgi:CRP-like cAMP-binding protein
MKILIEETDDDPYFAEMVFDQLMGLDSDAGKQIFIVPSLKHAHPLERDRYLAAEPMNWNIQTRLDLLARLSQAGHSTERIDPESAFDTVRLAFLSPGDVLIEARTPSAFVYMPLGPGLKIFPMGGYQSFTIKPWILIGITGVIRDAERSATVLAEQELQVLIIPKKPYLKYWHHTLSLEAFRQAVTEAISTESSLPGSLTQLEKSLLLQSVPLFGTLDLNALTELSTKVNEVRVKAGECLFEKGSIGQSLYLVVGGSLRIHDSNLILRELGEGDVFGEMAAITPEPRMASVTADSDSHLLRLDQKALNQLVGSNPAVAQGIIEMLARYIRDQVAERVQLQTKGQEFDHDV